jgi:teichuronic acid biosynthesis glycosyltransferase TuaC
MKVLIVQVGTPVDPAEHKGELLFREPTLTHGLRYFRYGEVVNNMQTRDSLKSEFIQVDHVYFTGRKNPVNCIKASLRLRKMVQQNQYDIVNQYWGGIASFFAALFCPAPYIISLLGSDLYGQYKPDGSKTWMGKMLSFFSQLTCLQANGIIVMSKKMKEKLWTSSQKKAVAIPEGISKGKFYPVEKSEARAKLNWDATAPIVIYFSQNAYVKNMPLAKASFEKLMEIIPTAQLKLVQGVPHAELLWYYNAADLLLLTSYHEGSNNSIKEALACNLPVVSVNVGDARERLENIEPSAVVDNFDAAQLATAMHNILVEPKRSNGQQTVHEVELPNIAERIIAFYKEVRSNQTAGRSEKNV